MNPVFQKLTRIGYLHFHPRLNGWVGARRKSNPRSYQKPVSGYISYVHVHSPPPILCLHPLYWICSWTYRRVQSLECFYASCWNATGFTLLNPILEKRDNHVPAKTTVESQNWSQDFPDPSSFQSLSPVKTQPPANLPKFSFLMNKRDKSPAAAAVSTNSNVSTYKSPAVNQTSGGKRLGRSVFNFYCSCR